MHKVEHITKDWKEAGSFAAQMNLYGFWEEHSFLTKSGDLEADLNIQVIFFVSRRVRKAVDARLSFPMELLL